MRTIDELTMYAYGLLEPDEEAPLRAHVDACPGCGEQVERLRSERRLLERAARRDPVSVAEQARAVDRASSLRPRRSLVPYALAGALLLGLAGLLLYRPGPGGTTGDAKRNVAADPLDRLIVELRSSNPLRREMAVVALMAYGQAAAARIQKADVEPALFPGTRWRAQDAAVLEVLRTKKLDLDFENERADVLLEAIGGRLGLKIVVDARDNPLWDPGKTITFKVRDLIGTNVLKLLGSQFSFEVFGEEGKVVLSGDRHPGPARAPIRIGNRMGVARELVRSLESPSGDERLRAEEELERLSFAAEAELWSGLDSPIAWARDAAARLLRTLYGGDSFEEPRGSAASAAVKMSLREKRVTPNINNAPLTAVVDYLTEISKIRIHFNVGSLGDPNLRLVSFKGDDLPIYSALTLMLEPMGLGFAVQDDAVVIALKDHVGVATRGAPLWTSADEAARIEALLEALGSRDMAARRKAEEGFAAMGERALAPLGQAARLLDLPLASHARALRNRILEEQGLWLPDEGSGADLQELTDEQKRLLGCKISFTFNAVPAGDVLSASTKTAGGRIDLRATPPGKVSLALRDVPLGTLLKALTRPHGLDFYLDGDLIIVDDESKVRAAVEK